MDEAESNSPNSVIYSLRWSWSCPISESLNPEMGQAQAAAPSVGTPEAVCGRRP